MAVPAAPLEGGTTPSKIMFVMDDNAGTNRANILRGYRQSTMNSESTAVMGVYDVSGSLENGNLQLASSSATQLLASSTPAQWAIIKARLTNAGTIYVGKSDVTADTNATTGGYPLDAGEAIAVPCSNLNQIYLRGTSGDGVAFIASLDA